MKSQNVGQGEKKQAPGECLEGALVSKVHQTPPPHRKIEEGEQETDGVATQRIHGSLRNHSPGSNYCPGGEFSPCSGTGGPHISPDLVDRKLCGAQC